MAVEMHRVNNKLGLDATENRSIQGHVAGDCINPAAIHDSLRMVPLLLDVTHERSEWRQADDHRVNDKSRTVPTAPLA